MFHPKQTAALPRRRKADCWLKLIELAEQNQGDAVATRREIPEVWSDSIGWSIPVKVNNVDATMYISGMCAGLRQPNGMVDYDDNATWTISVGAQHVPASGFSDQQVVINGNSGTLSFATDAPTITTGLMFRDQARVAKLRFQANAIVISDLTVPTYHEDPEDPTSAEYFDFYLNTTFVARNDLIFYSAF